jgi:lysophospholipase L1-like esterase
MNKIRLKFLSITLLFIGVIGSAQDADMARIYKAMDKGRNGEELKIGVIGGSITEGYAASSENRRWANLVADWWEDTFPDSDVVLINAGWGGTGSDIGTHRLREDLLVYEPDFFVIEFSVNDSEGEMALKMMEGMLQQGLCSENHPGIMLLMLKQDNGTTAQESHKPVAQHYRVPYVSFADRIDAKVAEDGVSLSSVFIDGLHPNDAGMNYIAGFIHEKLDSIYSTLPDENLLPEINTQLPDPLVTDVFSNTYQYYNHNIAPVNNQGWELNQTGWSASVPGQQIDFQIQGNAISLIFPRVNFATKGRVEVWVDDHPKSLLDCWMYEDWGTLHAYSLIQEGLEDGPHIVHIRVIPESSTDGHTVHIERIMAAGNVGSAPPIAITKSKQKALVNLQIEFDGSESFDPDGDSISLYEWTIVESPAESLAEIENPFAPVALFTPDQAGVYKISLEVSSGEMTGVAAIKTLSVQASNTRPVAVVGNDTISALNRYFEFDGSQSYDDDGDELVFMWELESKPEGSFTIISLPDSEKPLCKFDMEGDYVVSLVVYDSLEYSDKALITVESRDGYTTINSPDSNEDMIRAYPSPASSLITLEFYLQQPEPVSVKWLSIGGNCTREYTLHSTQSGLNRLIIDIPGLKLSKGIYMINVSGKSWSKTIRTTII